MYEELLGRYIIAFAELEFVVWMMAPFALNYHQSELVKLLDSGKNFSERIKLIETALKNMEDDKAKMALNLITQAIQFSKRRAQLIHSRHIFDREKIVLIEQSWNPNSESRLSFTGQDLAREVDDIFDLINAIKSLVPQQLA